MIWDQCYWSATSGRSCTHYDTNFGSVEDWSGTNGTHFEIDLELVDDDIGLGPVVGIVPSMTLTSGQLRTGLGPVVHTLRLTLSQWRTV